LIDNIEIAYNQWKDAKDHEAKHPRDIKDTTMKALEKQIDMARKELSDSLSR
jgi:hypothetical protein